MEKLFDIENGNCRVKLYDDGTRIVETLNPNDDHIELDQPLSLDINISNRCSNGCPYCYAGNTPTGKMADLLSMDYLDNVSGIEIAINIQYPLPENFTTWLEKMKNQHIVVNGTINQLDLERDNEVISQLASMKKQGLLHGIGLSYRSYNEELFNIVKDKWNDDVVIHVIVGITPFEDVIKLLENGFKVLVLGYKMKNRGIDYFMHAKIDEWEDKCSQLFKHPFNGVLAFDTAGINQLNVKQYLTDEEWSTYYQGDEGTISFYIDAVNRTFNTDSHTNEDPFDIEDYSLKEMFSHIKEIAKRRNHEES